MSDLPFQLPIGSGTSDPFNQVTRSPAKFTLRGVGADTPEGRAYMEQHQGAMRQFYQQQAQNSAAGVLNYAKVSTELAPGVKLTYSRNYGQEIVELDVTASVNPQERKIMKQVFDYDLGGYIAVDWSPSNAGQTLTFLLNGQQIGQFAFPSFSVMDTGAVVFKFGGDALKHHSYADAQNPLNGHLLQNPEPNATELPQYWIYDENAYPPDSKGLRISVSNYISPGSTASASFTPPIVATFELQDSLLIKGQNLFTATSDGPFGNGFVYAEFYARVARMVQQGWKEPAGPDKQIFVNDKPLKFAVSAGISGNTGQMNTSGPDADPTGTGLLFDLSKIS